jgi:hypothetical protein
MADFVIPCPNPTCRKPLNLPAAAIGRPLSCPHCKTPIGVTLNPDGTPTEPVVLPTSKRTPGMFLLPGFALLILGGAGVFMNGYIAWDAATQPGKDLVHSQRLVNDLRLSGSLKTGTPESKGTVGDAIPFELFGAVAGPAPGVAEQAKKAEEQAQADEALAAAWAPRVALAVPGSQRGVGGGRGGDPTGQVVLAGAGRVRGRDAEPEQLVLRAGRHRRAVGHPGAGARRRAEVLRPHGVSGTRSGRLANSIRSEFRVF